MTLTKEIEDAIKADRREEDQRQSKRAMFWVFCIIPAVVLVLLVVIRVAGPVLSE